MPTRHGSTHPGGVLRSATVEDIPQILRLVRALAEYEREADAVEATDDLYARSLFPPGGEPIAYAEVAEVDGTVVGVALWYTTFSTWTGRPGIWLEDLFVEPEHRGSGIGTALLTRLAGICVERDYRRLDWSVLDWNTPSIGFYESLGAVALDEWQQYRLHGAALASLAGGDGRLSAGLRAGSPRPGPGGSGSASAV
jgi:GNAT superfamily N-acetyltransferase